MSADKYVAPAFCLEGFTCPFCDVYANFKWTELVFRGSSGLVSSGVYTATCIHCKQDTVWLEEYKHMIWPQDISSAPLPNPDMPEEIKTDYLEARRICSVSPRGAAALLRLSLQKLCKFLGESGLNINQDIASLVSKGLPVKIQQALDIVRVTGNNAVHPGEMQLQEDPKIVSLLFGLINLVVENQVSQPKAIQALYGTLPSGVVDAVSKRDASKPS